MSRFRRFLTATATAFCVVALAIPAKAVTIVDLGFAFDRSLSISSSDFANARAALAAAVATIPTNNPEVQYRIGVVSFGQGAITAVSPTILTPATQAGVLAGINGMTQASGGATNMAFGINQLVSDFAAAGGLGDISLMNMTTDGLPNGGGNSQANTQAAAVAAAAAGWDSLSIEAVGSTVNQAAPIDFLASLAFPTPVQIVETGQALPNPLDNSFVLRVLDFDDYGDAIAAKVQLIVDETGGGGAAPIPLPAAGWLLISALGGMAALGHRQARLAA